MSASEVGLAARVYDRDLRLDALRGLCLVFLMLDHLPDFYLQPYIFQPFGLFSPAGGFVFISGLVSGWVYGRTGMEAGFRELKRRAFRRAGVIYLTQLSVFSVVLLAVLVRSMLTGHRGHYFIHGTPFWSFFWGALLVYQPYYFCVLPMYVLFLLLTPYALELLHRKKSWLVVGVSVAVWLAAQFGFGTPGPSWGYFNVFGWQLLFIAGLYFGHRTLAGPPLPHSRSLLVFCGILAALFFVLRHQIFLFGNPVLSFDRLRFLTEKNTCGALRLLSFGAFAYLVYRVPPTIHRIMQNSLPHRFLCYLGQHSLQVFAWSILVSAAAASLCNWWVLDRLDHTLLSILAVLSLMIPARLHQVYRAGTRAPSFGLHAGSLRPVRPS